MDSINILDFLSQVIRGCVWPLVVFLLFKKFEKEIKDLINEVKIRLSFGDKTVEISHDRLQELQQNQESPEKSELKELRAENKKNSEIQNILLELQSNTAKEKDVYFFGYYFERSYRLLFGSQIVILNHAYQFGSIRSALAESIHRRTVWKNTYPFNEYINYLVNSEFLSFREEDDSYIILPVGRAFIDYLNNNSMMLNKQPY